MKQREKESEKNKVIVFFYWTALQVKHRGIVKLDRYKLDRIVRIRPTHQATQWSGMDDGGNNMSYSGRAFVRW